MALSDSHVHLHAFADPDGVLARARAAGVNLVVGVGIDLPSSRRTLAIARAEPGVVAAVGLHPAHLTEASDLDQTLGEIEAIAGEPRVGFVGEIGIDLVEGAATLERQSEFFEAQLRLAGRLRLPVNLHIQGAFDEAFAIIRRLGAGGPGAVVHYFVGDAELARRALELGLYVSVGKPVTRPANAQLRQAVATIPLERLLLETDSYPLPGRTTEPADIRLVAEAVAGIRRIPVAEVAEATTNTLIRLLGERAVALRPARE
ncbi:MAG: TatD family hydrolase [Chloroflexota bacterium]